MKTLYWFQNDLRLHDNPGLLAQADAGQLLLVYCWRENRPWCNLKGLGGHRHRFLVESLQALRDSLAPLQQTLVVVYGNPEVEIPRLVQRHQIDQVATSQTHGYYEQQTLKHLSTLLPVPLRVFDSNSLFEQQALPFSIDQLPGQFTPFKKAVETLTRKTATPHIDKLPPPPASVWSTALPETRTPPHPGMPVRGGVHAGQRRLQHWLFTERGIARYKQTRNCLDPLTGSSTLSPWLANGCLSPREVASAVADYENRYGANESTGWLIFELLWREFFFWRALADGAALFKPAGIRGKLNRCTFEPRNFARWSQGDTNFPLVNALMRQLVATGWMSNRGRQIAASCLVNEYGIDWRYGAAFFEKHLIDYDVGSNYGNWQYIAGVGTDPRGGRHFNLDKQAREYDPEGTFTSKWGGFRPTQPDYVTDPADWPLPPEA